MLKIKSNSGRFYIFDAISNNIYDIDSEEDFNSADVTDLGYESSSRKNALIFDEMHNHVVSNAKTLIVELTESCNIRCTYCVFDDADTSERNHSEENISDDVAIKSIDDFFKRTNGEVGYLVFYGGEPLLSFKLIKKMVEHANAISARKIKFSFTTNAISLSKEKFCFLVDNDFRITVSVDGPKEIHDKRRISKNGKGTFDIIEKNLTELLAHDGDFYYKNIEFNCTISDFNDTYLINEFFKNSTLFRRDLVRFSPVIKNNIKIDKEISASISDEDLRSSLSENGVVILRNHQAPEPIQDAFIGEIVRKIKYRLLDEKAGDRKKICVPFANRTYVRSNGTLQFCERIQSYGALHEETTLEQASKQIYDEFYELKGASCRECFAYNFCDMCPASFMENGGFSENLSSEKCSEYRKNVKRAMTIYINAME